MIYGYLRGSNGEIDKNNQEKAIEKYAKNNDLKVIYTEDTISSGKPYKERKIKDLVESMRDGDTLIVAELSRLARNTEEVLRIGREVVERDSSLIILNPSLELKADCLNSKVLLTVMGLAADIERYYIKSRTKISLQQKKELLEKQGYFISKAGEKITSLGCPKGIKKTLKLEKFKDDIIDYHDKGLSLTKIAKIYDVSRHTVASFLKRVKE